MRPSRPARSHLALLSGAAALCLLLLAACEDPSGVGITVIEPGESDPRAQVFPATSTANIPLSDPTGAFATATNFNDFRALAGYVADPLFGTTVAQAYIDVLPETSLSDEFQGRPVREAKLRLRRSYAYGDTAAATTLDIRQIAEEWTAVGATADTTFPVMDGVIISFEVAPEDTLIEVALPQAWIEANDEMLRSDDFSTLFHGFRLSTDATSGAVYGFNGSSTLELVSAEDTVIYKASELFSGLVHEPAPTSPAGLLTVQDGTSTGLEVAFVLDTLGAPALNTAFLRVNADTAASQTNLPPGFVRPLARELALFGTFEDADPILLTTAELDEETQVYSFRATVLTGLLQELLLNREPVDGFAVGVPPSRSSLDAITLVALPAATGPRAVLFLVPTD